MSENSATCANCRLLFPLPFPPRRPPRLSTTVLPVKIMKKRKSRIWTIRNVPKKYIQHLHPSLRSIVECGNRRWKVRRSRWLKVRNRLLYYRPHARVFPWYCETCTLSSRFLSVIQNHSCPNKNLSRHVQDFANEQRIALLGFRSKAKDALAVMERVYNPQAIDLNKVNFPLEVPGSDSTIINVVPSLSEICLAVITPKSTHKKSLKKLLPRAHFHVQPVSRRIRPSKNTGQLCTVCHQLFPVFLDYEDHLLNGQCANDIPPDPVPIHMSDPGNIPWKYEIPTVPQIKESSGLMICSLCHDDRFSSTELFHEHIIDCGRKLAAFL